MQKNQPNSNDAIKYFILGSLISADSESLTEDEKQAIITRMSQKKDDWNYIFEPVEDMEKRNKIIDLLESLDQKEIEPVDMEVLEDGESE